MDFVFVIGGAVLWGAMALLVAGLDKLAPKGATLMIADAVLYGAGAFCAILLLAYLVYALICAEDF